PCGGRAIPQEYAQMRHWHALKDFGRVLKSDWISMITGPASFILAALGAIFQQSFSPLIFWPAAYICLLIFTFRLWYKLQRPIRLSAHQLWEQFRADPIGIQTRLRMVQIAGSVSSIRGHIARTGVEVQFRADSPQDDVKTPKSVT